MCCTLPAGRNSTTMLNAKTFLAVDFGAATIKVAEFDINEAGGLVLRQWGTRSLGQDGVQEATREPAMLKALQDFRTGVRVGTQASMAEAVRGLSDADLADLAYFQANFRPKRP